MSLNDEIKLGTVLMVRWINSWKWGSCSKDSVEKLDETAAVQMTCGTLIRQTEDNLFIAQCSAEFSFDNIFQIPKNTIKDIKVLS